MINYSVIIPIYNMERYLEECINSVIIQNRNDIEIILVNDGSSDRSLEICKNFKKKYDNIILIDKKNTGTTDTILSGIKLAQGNYTCFIDADDKIVENYFEILDQYINSGYDIIMYNYKKMYRNTCINMEINKIPYGLLDERLIYQLHNEFFSNFDKYSLYRWDKLIKTEIIKETAKKIKVKATYLEDHIISFLNLLNSKKIMYIKDFLYLYRMRKNSVSHSINEKIFEDWESVRNEMINIANENLYNKNQKNNLQLYFLYQYARYSLKSSRIHYKEKVKVKDIINTKDIDKRIVLTLYKFKLKKVYKAILNLKLKKEKSKTEGYFD